MITIDKSELSFVSQFNFIFGFFSKILNEHPSLKIWVAGGALSSVLTQRKINDFDIFSNNPLLLCDLVHDLVKTEQLESFQNDQVFNVIFRNKKIQIIKNHVFATPQHIVECFDFTACSAAYDGKTLVAHDRFFIDNAQKRLVVNALPYPLSSLNRTYKYVSYGFSLCPVGLNTIIKTIVGMNIDFDNPIDNSLIFYPDGRLKFTGID